MRWVVRWPRSCGWRWPVALRWRVAGGVAVAGAGGRRELLWLPVLVARAPVRAACAARPAALIGPAAPAPARPDPTCRGNWARQDPPVVPNSGDKWKPSSVPRVTSRHRPVRPVASFWHDNSHLSCQIATTGGIRSDLSCLLARQVALVMPKRRDKSNPRSRGAPGGRRKPWTPAAHADGAQVRRGAGRYNWLTSSLFVAEGG